MECWRAKLQLRVPIAVAHIGRPSWKNNSFCHVQVKLMLGYRIGVSVMPVKYCIAEKAVRACKAYRAKKYDS